MVFKVPCLGYKVPVLADGLSREDMLVIPAVGLGMCRGPSKAMAIPLRLCNRALAVAPCRARSRAMPAPPMAHNSRDLPHTCNNSNPIRYSSRSNKHLHMVDKQATRPLRPVCPHLAPMEPSSLVQGTVGKPQPHHMAMESRQAKHPLCHSSLRTVSRRLAPTCLVGSTQGPCSSQHMASKEDPGPPIRRPTQAR